MTGQPFRFAVQSVDATSGKEWREVAVKAEDLGFSTLFVADHYLGPGPAGGATLLAPQQLAPIAAMASAAAATSTLRVGCRVFCIDYHVPTVLAKEAATIDLLSDGRLEFGIGAGWHGAEYEAMGLTFDPGPTRVARLEEAVAVIKAHWTGQQIDFDGDHIRVGGFSGLPLPVQKPHPPIMIGGSRPRVLSLAGREADIVSLANVPWVAVNDAGLTPMQEAARRVGFARDAAGGRFAGLEIESSPYFSEVTSDRDGALERMAARMRGADPDVLSDHPNVLVGGSTTSSSACSSSASIWGSTTSPCRTTRSTLSRPSAPVCAANEEARSLRSDARGQWRVLHLTNHSYKGEPKCPEESCTSKRDQRRRRTSRRTTSGTTRCTWPSCCRSMVFCRPAVSSRTSTMVPTSPSTSSTWTTSTRCGPGWLRREGQTPAR